MKVNINDLSQALNGLIWNFDFKITVHNNGLAHLEIPSFILEEIKPILKQGKATSLTQVTLKHKS